MNSFILYAFLVLALCSAGSSMVLDRCLVPMLKADLSFTLVDFGSSDEVHRIDFKQPQNALIKGYGKWKFSVVQNKELNGLKGLNVSASCVEDCPDDSFDLPATFSAIVRKDEQLLFNTTLVFAKKNGWYGWRDPSERGFHMPYEALSSRPYGQNVTVSFALFVPRPDGQCTNIDTEKARSEFADLCFRSIDISEEMATVQFRDGNISVYPEVLRKYSIVLSELLDIRMEREEPLVIDLREFSREVGKMFVEVLCSGVIKATVNDNRAQHFSNLMKLYELGHKTQMDNIMLGAIDGFKNLHPKPTGSEAYDFVDLLAILKSQVGNDFRDNFLEVRTKSELFQSAEEPKPQSH
ncbi:hypothetical protein MP638_002214 [Amoeboaphelidium occidentale]|nr:hypothetical protein MP638_002214 [Amoeboaphelidium occidentale]